MITNPIRSTAAADRNKRGNYRIYKGNTYYNRIPAYFTEKRRFHFLALSNPYKKKDDRGGRVKKKEEKIVGKHAIRVICLRVLFL